MRFYIDLRKQEAIVDQYTSLPNLIASETGTIFSNQSELGFSFRQTFEFSRA